jgi:hypothetical protein
VLLRIWRYTWPLPLTLAGLMLAFTILLFQGKWALSRGVLEVTGPAARWLLRCHPVHGVIAMALGHVVIARDASCRAQTSAHEREHVRQFERWGLLFPFIYGGESFYRWLRGEHPYRDNRFERAADRAALFESKSKT